MAEDAAKKGKGRLLFHVAMAFASILMCAGGVWLGTKLTSSTPPESDEGVPGIPEFNPATASANTQASQENTQPFEAVPSADGSAARQLAAADGAAESARTVAARSGDDEVVPASPFADSQQVSLPAIGGDELNSDPLSNHIAMADDELRGGSYANALRIYQVAFEQVEGIGKAAVLYRMGLCAEASGNYLEAADRYRQVTRSFSSTPWGPIGRLGEARCLAALGRIESLSAGTMRPVLLDQSMFSPAVRGELMHVCGRAFCRAFLPDGAPPLLEDTGLIMPPWLTDPDRELDILPALLKSEPQALAAPKFELLQQTDRLPGSTYLKAFSPTAPVDQLLQAVCDGSGFQLQLTESSKAALRGRTQQLQCPDVNLATVLDGLTIPFGLFWWHDEQGVHIATSAEAEHAAVVAFQRQFGIRLLQNALVHSPDSDQASFSRLALGVLQFQNGSPVEAAYTFQSQMEIDPRSEVESEAAFNLGKCYLASAQLGEARNAFLLAVDASLHNPNTAVVAYLYVGRMQIEEGHFQSAVSSMVRALAMCRDTDLEPHAALLLASAYLMADSPEGASSVLMERREEFESHRGRNAGAFLSALSRFQRAVLPGPRERAGRALVTALTRFRPQHQFGSHWMYLHARACEDLGLIPQAIQGYTETVKRLPAAPLRQQAMVRLAAQFRFERRLDEAALLLSGVSEAPESRLGQQISMQAALIALDRGDGQTAVDHCRKVIRSTEEEGVRRAALQVMGKAYEQLNNHKAAVYCFAGMLPHQTPAEQQRSMKVMEESESSSRPSKDSLLGIPHSLHGPKVIRQVHLEMPQYPVKAIRGHDPFALRTPTEAATDSEEIEGEADQWRATRSRVAAGDSK
ncbi:MAG: hypothetical protein Fues2KO_08250 [Fuerstiella sp.]